MYGSPILHTHTCMLPNPMAVYIETEGLEYSSFQIAIQQSLARAEYNVHVMRPLIAFV